MSVAASFIFKILTVNSDTKNKDILDLFDRDLLDFNFKNRWYCDHPLCLPQYQTYGE